MVELKTPLALPFSLSATFKMGLIKFEIVFIALITMRLATGSVPGTFFWKPRMAIDLEIPRTARPIPVRPVSWPNIRDGYVVLIEGYRAGMTIIAIAGWFDDSPPHPHLDINRAAYYNNMYRWGLRHISLLPLWFEGGNYADTHKVWRRRFFYMDRVVPHWMRRLLPHIDEQDWSGEEFDLRRFNKYAEPSFGKHYRFPGKVFNNFNSARTTETIENWNQSDLSLKSG